MSRLAHRRINQMTIRRYRKGITLINPRLKTDFGNEPTTENTSSTGNVPNPNNTIKRKLFVSESAFIAEAMAIYTMPQGKIPFSTPATKEPPGLYRQCPIFFAKG